jgi:CDP-2,3-bis-(O-geranylgeranyl)-sn-glycerol synthase
MEIILFALWFFIPAGVANSAPVFANKVPLLKKLGMPIDGGRTFRGKRIFGNHKTFRGFLVGVIAAVAVSGLQMILYSNFDWAKTVSRNIDYSDPIILLVGALLGFGALAGDAFESFVKRQLSIESGKSWFPFDQIDYIIGALIFSAPLITLNTNEYITIFVVWFLIHPVATLIGWMLKLKDSPI